jgi:hypothetical protein
MVKQRIKPNYRRRLLRLPDLDHCKRSVLNSLGSPASRRVYEYAIDQFIAWYCSEPRLAFNRIVVVRYRMHLESRGLAANTINQQLAAVRRLARETSDSGLLSPAEVQSLFSRRTLSPTKSRSHSVSLRPMQDASLIGFQAAPLPEFALPSRVYSSRSQPCIKILRACRQGVNPGGKLLVVECVIPQLGECLEIHRLRCGNPSAEPIFATGLGTRLSTNNLLNRLMPPALNRCQRCGLPDNQVHLKQSQKFRREMNASQSGVVGTRHDAAWARILIGLEFPTRFKFEAEMAAHNSADTE